MKIVGVLDESVEVGSAMGPNEKDVVEPDFGFVWTGIQQLPLQASYVEVGVVGSHVVPYICSQILLTKVKIFCEWMISMRLQMKVAGSYLLVYKALTSIVDRSVECVKSMSPENVIIHKLRDYLRLASVPTDNRLPQIAFLVDVQESIESPGFRMGICRVLNVQTEWSHLPRTFSRLAPIWGAPGFNYSETVACNRVESLTSPLPFSA